MIKPKALKPGSTIGIVAPASDVKPEFLQPGVEELKRLGFNVKLAGGIHEKYRYFAGLHQRRAHALIEMFQDPEVDAIICARGGYGCHYLVEQLPPEIIFSHPKIFMGYSDVTLLLQFIENRCGMIAFHGPMVAWEFARHEPFYNRESLFECLTRTTPGQKIAASGLETLRGGTCGGLLTGGCLSLITAALGTPYELQTEGRILFLEDVNAKPYQVDRMLMQLRLAGKFEAVQGIIFGQMLDCGQGADETYRLQDIVSEILQPYRFPILYGLPSGHTSSGCLTLPLGVPVLLDASEKYLELLEGAVQ